MNDAATLAHTKLWERGPQEFRDDAFGIYYREVLPEHHTEERRRRSPPKYSKSKIHTVFFLRKKLRFIAEYLRDNGPSPIAEMTTVMKTTLNYESNTNSIAFLSAAERNGLLLAEHKGMLMVMNADEWLAEHPPFESHEDALAAMRAGKIYE